MTGPVSYLNALPEPDLPLSLVETMAEAMFESSVGRDEPLDFNWDETTPRAKEYWRCKAKVAIDVITNIHNVVVEGVLPTIDELVTLFDRQPTTRDGVIALEYALTFPFLVKGFESLLEDMDASDETAVAQ